MTARMKQIGVWMFCVLLGLAKAQSGRPEIRPATVSGIVLNADSLQPVEGAVVYVDGDTQGAPATAVPAAKTDRDGHFEIPSVSATQYVVTAQKSGFVTAAHRVSTASGNPAEPNSQLEIRLVQQAVVTGRITDLFGEPIMGAMVRLNRVKLDGRRTALATVTQVPTDDQGQYRIFGVEPGRYYISASFQDAAGSLGLLSRATADGERVTEDYAVTYYPNATSPETATLIKLQGGKVVTNIDLRIARARSYPVSGTIMGLPSVSPSLGVFLHPADPASLGPERLSVVSPGDSRFRFWSVPPGNYVLKADLDLGGQRFSARREVTVTSASANVSLELVAPFSLAGAVTTESGEKSQGNVRLKLQGLDSRKEVDLTLNANGQFQVSNIGPDVYNIVVSDDSGKTYVKSLSLDGARIRVGSFAILGPNHKLNLTLGEKAAQVAGVATDLRQNPVSRGIAVLVGVDTSDTQSLALPLDAQGRFKFQSLAPGRYRIMCFSDLTGPGDANWEVQKKVQAEGKELTIAEGDSPQLTVEARQLDAN